MNEVLVDTSGALVARQLLTGLRRERCGDPIAAPASSSSGTARGLRPRSTTRPPDARDPLGQRQGWARRDGHDPGPRAVAASAAARAGFRTGVPTRRPARRGRARHRDPTAAGTPRARRPSSSRAVTSTPGRPAAGGNPTTSSRPTSTRRRSTAGASSSRPRACASREYHHSRTRGYVEWDPDAIFGSASRRCRASRRRARSAAAGSAVPATAAPCAAASRGSAPSSPPWAARRRAAGRRPAGRSPPCG